MEWTIDCLYKEGEMLRVGWRWKILLGVILGKRLYIWFAYIWISYIYYYIIMVDYIMLYCRFDLNKLVR